MVPQLQQRGDAAEWLSAAKARELEPRLADTTLGALYARDDAQVDNRALAEALAVAFARADGVLREGCEARSLYVVDQRVHGVVTTEGAILADRVVLAAGAWSSLGSAQYQLPPVRPAKGQMAALTPPPGEAMPQRLVWGEGVYIVPREDTLLLGATVEDTGFETSVSREARDRLIAAAARLMPSLEEWKVSESWAGLRPRTPDSLPVLGETAIAGLFIASGQFRNGILFAPAIADQMRRLVFGSPPDAMTRAFDPKRFTSAE
jgi:glycine oxidase